LTQFKTLKSKEYIFEQKTGDPMAVNGYVSHSIIKDEIYSICFESLDNNEKQVAFDYAQAHRQKHFTKGTLGSQQTT